MEDNLKIKWKTNQSTKINLIGCDTIVNAPSSTHYLLISLPKWNCQAQSQLQVKLSLKTELALFSINPAPTHPPTHPPDRESLFSSFTQSTMTK
jgi:hypothetical protein